MTRIFNRTEQKATRQRLRGNMPPCEVILWSRLRDRQVHGARFRRQSGVGPYVVDFYCPRLKLAIEVDGDSHFSDGAEQRDAERQAHLESLGVRVLRFNNVDVRRNLMAVLDRIADTVLAMQAE